MALARIPYWTYLGVVLLVAATYAFNRESNLGIHDDDIARLVRTLPNTGLKLRFALGEIDIDQAIYLKNGDLIALEKTRHDIDDANQILKTLSVPALEGRPGQPEVRHLGEVFQATSAQVLTEMELRASKGRALAEARAADRKRSDMTSERDRLLLQIMEISAQDAWAIALKARREIAIGVGGLVGCYLAWMTLLVATLIHLRRKRITTHNP